MTRATVIADSLLHRLEAQMAPLGVDVRLHLANVLEMVERLPGHVENPPGLLVDWCNREAQARQAVRARSAADQERYAELQVELYIAVSAGCFTPRELARVLLQCAREQYPALNPKTIEKLRALGGRWPAPPESLDQRVADRAKDAGGRWAWSGTGRSDAGATS